MSGYVKTFKGKDGSKDKNNKLLSFRIDDDKLLGKYKTFWNKIEELENTILNPWPVYDDTYIKTKIRTYGDNFYTNSGGLNVLEDDVERESSTIIYIDSFIVYENKYYLQVYLDNCAYEIVGKQITDDIDDNLSETDEN